VQVFDVTPGHSQSNSILQGDYLDNVMFRG